MKGKVAVLIKERRGMEKMNEGKDFVWEPSGKD